MPAQACRELGSIEWPVVTLLTTMASRAASATAAPSSCHLRWRSRICRTLIAPSAERRRYYGGAGTDLRAFRGQCAARVCGRSGGHVGQDSATEKVEIGECHERRVREEYGPAWAAWRTRARGP